MTCGLRRGDDGFPRRRWLGRDPSSRAGLGGAARRESPCRPLRGPLLLRGPPPGGRARRPSLASSVLPSVRLGDREPARPARPGSRSSPPRVRRTDRRETSAGPKGGEAGGRCGRSPLRASLPRAAGVPLRPRQGPAASRLPRRRVGLFPRRQFPSPNTWAGYPRRRPRPGSAAVQSLELPRVARPGTGELRLDSPRPPRRPRGLPSGGVPGRAERPVVLPV